MAASVLLYSLLFRRKLTGTAVRRGCGGRMSFL